MLIRPKQANVVGVASRECAFTSRSDRRANPELKTYSDKYMAEFKRSQIKMGKVRMVLVKGATVLV